MTDTETIELWLPTDFKIIRNGEEVRPRNLTDDDIELLAEEMFWLLISMRDRASLH